MLQTQVTNPEVATFQSFSKGVYDYYAYRKIIAVKMVFVIFWGEDKFREGGSCPWPPRDPQRGLYMPDYRPFFVGTDPIIPLIYM